MINLECAELGVKSMDKLIEYYKYRNPGVDLTTIIINVIAKHQDECGFGENVYELLHNKMV